MRLRGIDLGPCLDASGLRGLDGKTGYRFHHLPLVSDWYDFLGSTPVAKTYTYPPTDGHMPLEEEYPFRPVEWFPKCVWFSLRHGIALNAVGLSNPGSEVLLQFALPKVISFMAVGKTPEARLSEVCAFVRELAELLERMPDGYELVLQINISCPNAGLDPAELIREALAALDAAAALSIPIMVKLNVLAGSRAVYEIAAHDACDAIVCSNTIPFGTEIPGFANQVPWKHYFPDSISPLSKRGLPVPGGLSGKPLLPIVAEWLSRIRDAGIDVPINAGGGILKPGDVDTLVRAGLRRHKDSIFIGTIAMICPWNIRSVIRRSHELLG